MDEQKSHFQASETHENDNLLIHKKHLVGLLPLNIVINIPRGE
jgi:hypothetical protein